MGKKIWLDKRNKKYWKTRSKNLAASLKLCNQMVLERNAVIDSLISNAALDYLKPK